MASRTFVIVPAAALATAGIVTSTAVAVSVAAAWDTLTYHYTKAALWVQGGGPIDLETPGGFAAYVHRLGGGEVFDAWAMLPTHSDLLAPSIELLWWLGVGVALLALGRELGLRARSCWVAAAFGCSTPALCGLVGAGFVEPVQSFATLLGLVFGVRYLRHRSDARESAKAGPALALSVVAFSLAAGIKVNAFPALTVATLFLLVSLRASPPGDGRRFAKWLLCGLALGATAYGPWMGWNAIELGRPLAFPFSIGPLQVGDEPSMRWFINQALAEQAYDVGSELRTLAIIFGSPFESSDSLTALWLAPLLLGLLGAFRGGAEQRTARWLILSVCLSYVAVFYHPSFSASRLDWDATSSRFLLPGLLPLIPLSIGFFHRRSRACSIYEALLTAAALLLAGLRCWRDVSFDLVVPLIVVVAMICMGTALTVVTGATRRRAFASVVALSLFAVPLLHFHRQVHGRSALLRRELAESNVWHRYWLSSAEFVDRPGLPRRIAVTAGFVRDSDNWFLYPFLGSELQNELRYIPVSPGSRIIPLEPNEKRAELADYETWHRRLAAAEITHVMSFLARSIELGWMAEHPETFEQIAGDGRVWGLFAFTPRQLDIRKSTASP